MERHIVTRVSISLATALLCGSALAQQNNIVWWEHSNPPHNNYSKELVADWNA
jgi:ABC-type glycerol-3-phosphate transport system substrate-binding protein